MSTVSREDLAASSIVDELLCLPRTRAEAGTKLPTERALEQELGLSRHNLRRALALLEAEGWISREVGRGTFLVRSTWNYQPGDLTSRARGNRSRGGAAARARRAAASSGTLRELADVGPADVIVARHVIEPNAMKYVVAHATSRDFETLRDCIVGGDGATTYDEFEFWDLELHRAIIGASHNPLLVSLYERIEEARHSPIWGELKRGSTSTERRSAYCADHHTIVDALVQRDTAGATKAMQAHLTRIEQDLFTSALSMPVPPARARRRPR
jgi:DNA-binding FadR family transcriptional regulator